MNLYIPRKLIDLTSEILEITERPVAEQQKLAIKEIYRQCHRIFDLYDDRKSGNARRQRRALYWNQIDTFALYTLTSCQDLSKEAVNRALRDLSVVEAALAQMTPSEVRVYNKFSLILESLTKPPRKLSIAKFTKRIKDWVRNFTPEQVEFLVKLIEQGLVVKAETEFIYRSVNDAIKRIKGTLHPTIKERLSERLQYIIAQFKHANATRDADSQCKADACAKPADVAILTADQPAVTAEQIKDKVEIETGV
jgi:hypothetical protein